MSSALEMIKGADHGGVCQPFKLLSFLSMECGLWNRDGLVWIKVTVFRMQNIFYKKVKQIESIYLVIYPG